MKRAVGYVRISQPDEDPNNQRYVIEKWARNNNYEVIFMPPEQVTGEEDPLKRPVFRIAIEFAKTNNIDTIIMTDIMRFSRRYEYTIERLAELASQGIKIVFVNTPLPTLDEFYKNIERIFTDFSEDNPYMKTMSKAIKDIMLSIIKLANDMMLKLYAAQSEAYLQEVRMRVKSKMAKLREEGRIYHRPRLIHYIALYYSGKEEFKELTQEDVEEAKKQVVKILKPYVDLKVPLYQIVKIFRNRFADVYREYPQAPKSYDAIKRLLKDIGLCERK